MGCGQVSVVRQGGVTDINRNHTSHWIREGDHRGLIGAAASHQDVHALLIATLLMDTVRPEERLGMTRIEPLPIPLQPVWDIKNWCRVHPLLVLTGNNVAKRVKLHASSVLGVGESFQ
jgi:hypothetical protein